MQITKKVVLAIALLLPLGSVNQTKAETNPWLVVGVTCAVIAVPVINLKN